MHVSPLLLGVAIASTSATAAALPRGRSRGRIHSAASSFLKLRSPPAPPAERFVILPEEPVQVTEKREIASADVYHRPSAADDVPAVVHAAAVPVSTDSIDTSSGKNTQQPDIKVDDAKVSQVVSSLVASVEAFETYTYSNYGAGLTASSSSPVATATSDPIQEAIRAAESYAMHQKVPALPTVTVHLVMEPTQEADGSWDYVVKVGPDGTATASPTWMAAPTSTASSSASDYYVPSASASVTAEPLATIVSGEQSAPVTSTTPEYYYGNTHTYNGTTSTDSELPNVESNLPIFETIRTLATTSSHFAFQCADTSSYYYSDTSDATQVCPGGTVCRFVNTACSPCVWPDQDIWCAGKVYPFVDPAPEESTEPALPSSTEASVQPTTQVSVGEPTTRAPVSEPTPTQVTTYVTGSGYHSASGETGRGAVTFTYTTSNAAVPTAITTPSVTSQEAPSSSVSDSGYASAPVETAWTSGHGGQHSYPWMTEPAATITSVESVPAPTSVEMTTTLSNGVIIATLVPSSASSASQSASTSVNSWLVEATKGPDPIHVGSSSVSSAQPTASVTESVSATITSVESVSVSTTEGPTTEQASSTYASEPYPTAAPPSGSPFNETSTQSNVETATATDSDFAPTSTQSAIEESATTTWASSSSGILDPSSAAGNGTDIVLPTASVTSQASEPVLTASASASITDPTDNGIATETVTDWDIVNATSTTYVPWETASATATLTASESASAQPTDAFTSQRPTNQTVSATDSASTSAPVESASSTQSTWESLVSSSATSASGTSVQATESATSSAAQSTESVSATATSTSSAAESTETGSDEDECEEWEELWVDEADIQPDWIVVE